jgi:hypothetical protein
VFLVLGISGQKAPNKWYDNVYQLDIPHSTSAIQLTLVTTGCETVEADENEFSTFNLPSKCPMASRNALVFLLSL